MNVVSISHRPQTLYPANAPYWPPSLYPELEANFQKFEVDPVNVVYETVREAFRLFRYDTANYGTEGWNPLGWLVHPGETVFIKPNMIAEKHKESDAWEFVITHGSVIRAVMDYVFIAMHGRGRVIVGDAPQTDSRFSAIVERMGLKEIRSVYRKFPDFEFDIINLQEEYWIEKEGIHTETVSLLGDPLGSIAVDLGSNSSFAELDGTGKKYYGAFYDVDETNHHHTAGRHEYLISRSPIQADVFINIPKLKTHKKCGLTVNLKSLVGINARKNWLPHYVIGSPATGGDQFPTRNVKSAIENAIVLRAKTILLEGNPVFRFMARKLKSIGYRVFGNNKNTIRSGNWHGNDTVWRMSLDLNRILLYSNLDGTMRTDGRVKRFFSVVDGILAMEGDGPVAGLRKDTGVIVAGDNPVAVDATCAKLMGFDYKKIPIIARAFDHSIYPLISDGYDSIQPVSNKAEWDRSLRDWRNEKTMHFKPHFGWAGHIEEN